MRAISYIILLGGQGLFAALLSGCPKNDSSTSAADANAAPTASASQVTLAPLDSSTAAPTVSAGPVTTLGGGTATTTPAHSGSGAIAIKPPAIDGSLPVATSTATPATQNQFKQCCAALHKQSQQQSPQAAQLAQAAGVCDGLVAAMANAQPQMDQVKMLLQGVQLPPVCQGL